MSSRGSTWRGKHHQTKKQKVNTRRGQRNRLFDDKLQAQLGPSQIPRELFEHQVEVCKSKVPHKTRGAAYQAKLDCEKKFGKEFYEYECGICGCWHLTSHPWEGHGRYE